MALICWGGCIAVYFISGRRLLSAEEMEQRTARAETMSKPVGDTDQQATIAPVPALPNAPTLVAKRSSLKTKAPMLGESELQQSVSRRFSTLDKQSKVKGGTSHTWRRNNSQPGEDALSPAASNISVTMRENSVFLPHLSPLAADDKRRTSEESTLGLWPK